MNRRDALVQVIDCLHAEIAALRTNDIAALQRATQAKLATIETLAANDDAAPPAGEIRALAEEADRLNETARIYVNLMAANVRRRLNELSGHGFAGYSVSGRAA